MSKQWPDKTIIGLTGNIATGKSAVMRMAAEQGALAIDADKVVHQLLETEPALQQAVVAAFGPEVRRHDGAINRTALGAIVFSDPQALRRLEEILHPAVRKRIYHQIDENPARVVVIEAIKLLEGELVTLVDQIWVTRAPRRTQIERLVICRGMDVETATLRVNAQNPQEAKVARADVVIDTDGTMATTRSQFERAWERIVTHTGDGARPPQTKAAPSPAPRPRPDAVAPQPAAKAAASLAPSPSVRVRRARPSDVAAVLLLIQRATGGAMQMKRADLLMALSERSYLIAQEKVDINMVVGWSTHSTTAVAIDQIYTHPIEAALTSGPALLAEVEKSARELICEVVFVFLPPDAPAPVQQLLQQSSYRPLRESELRRAWRDVIAETQPAGTRLVGKILRGVRIR
ncbi:MAG: dephospho-CoA kinase [Anaerolineae bacterium]|nr:dephospho-CoA kinase [Anaerolineae bacterium]